MKIRLLKSIVVLMISAASSGGQPFPHQVSGIEIASNQTVTISIQGSVSNLLHLSPSISSVLGRMFDLYPLDSSPDLVNWTRLSILLRTNSDLRPLEYQESYSASSSGRFYRTPTNYFITGFPKPTGPYSVGTLARVLTDSSRSNRFGVPTNSSFMCTVWYPADPPASTQLPAPYADAPVVTDPRFYGFWTWPSQWTNVMVRCVTLSFRDLPVAAGTERFPVILYSHGWSFDRASNSQDALELASHGYIVLGVDHEDCHATVFPDARGVIYTPVPPALDGSVLVPSRIKDLEYVLGQLQMIDQADPVLAGRLDLDRLGVMGLSYGGGTAAEVARLDDRVKCAALLEPVISSDVYPGLFSQGVKKPLLLINTPLPEYPTIIPSPAEFYAMSQTLFDLATTNVNWFVISEVGHVSGLSDLAWTIKQSSATRPGAIAINASLVWFFDTYLKGESPPFPTNSPITNLLRK